jgi:alanyl-tRNA synthetase
VVRTRRGAEVSCAGSSRASGGTHLADTADIGAIVVTKIEKKSASTRRVVLGFAEPAEGRARTQTVHTDCLCLAKDGASGSG